MDKFPVYTIESAPDASKPSLREVQARFGMIPNLAGAMALSPVLIKSFVPIFDQVHGGSFTEAQIQTVLLTDAVTNGSTWAVALHTALEDCTEFLLTHGGHAMAAGLSLHKDKLESFRRKMEHHVSVRLTAENLTPKLEVDDEVPIGAVTRSVVRELERLAPHGPGNPVPLLVASRMLNVSNPSDAPCTSNASRFISRPPPFENAASLPNATPVAPPL